jgi:dipeptidyl aminopeptidase/acylaminoacyl peptidase
MAPPDASGALRQWIDRLKDPVAARRLEAALVLGSFGTFAEEAALDLCSALKDADSHVGKLAADAIVQVTKDAGPVVVRLAELLGDPSAEARRRAAEVISSFGAAAKAALPALTAALKDPDPLVQRWAAFALGEVGPDAKEAVNDLLEFRAAASDLRSRAMAGAALKKIDPETANRNAFTRTGDAVGEVGRVYGHRYWVQSVAFSPDGKSAVSASGQPAGVSPGDADNTIRLWDVATGREVRCLEGHEGWVTGVAYSPDGRRCLSGSYDSSVRLWDLETGRQLHCLRGHLDRVRGVAYSPDGRHGLSGGCDKALILWDLEAGREVHRFRKHRHWVIAVAFSPDGHRALSGGFDGTVRLWNVAGGEEVGGKGGWLRHLWALMNLRELRRIAGHSQSVTSVAFAPDGRLALSGSMDRTVRLWDLRSGAPVREFKGHRGGVMSVAFAPDGSHVLSGGVDRTLCLWETATGKLRHCFDGHTDVVTSVAVSPDGGFALSGSADRTLRLWRLPPREGIEATNHPEPRS